MARAEKVASREIVVVNQGLIDIVDSAPTSDPKAMREQIATLTRLLRTDRTVSTWDILTSLSGRENDQINKQFFKAIHEIRSMRVDLFPNSQNPPPPVQILREYPDSQMGYLGEDMSPTTAVVLYQQNPGLPYQMRSLISFRPPREVMADPDKYADPDFGLLAAATWKALMRVAFADRNDSSIFGNYPEICQLAGSERPYHMGDFSFTDSLGGRIVIGTSACEPTIEFVKALFYYFRSNDVDCDPDLDKYFKFAGLVDAIAAERIGETLIGGKSSSTVKIGDLQSVQKVIEAREIAVARVSNSDGFEWENFKNKLKALD